jgi:hypothetical protein
MSQEDVMPTPSRLSSHPTPRAGVDPILCPEAALAVIDIARSQPERAEHLCILLGDDRCGHAIVSVVDPPDDDSVLAVIDTIGSACDLAGFGGEQPAALIVATIRPDHSTDPGDAARWQLAEIAAGVHGVLLLEWFVIGPDGVECPRELAGRPARW